MDIYSIKYNEAYKTFSFHDPRLIGKAIQSIEPLDEITIIGDCEKSDIAKPIGDFMNLSPVGLLMNAKYMCKLKNELDGEWKHCIYPGNGEFYLYAPQKLIGTIDEDFSRFTYAFDIFANANHLSRYSKDQLKESKRIIFKCDYLRFIDIKLPPLFFIEQYYPVPFLCTDEFRKMTVGCTGIEFNYIGST